MEAYKSVLQEEGVPFEFRPPSFILSKEPSTLVKFYPVIIFPDGIARSLPYDTSFWLDEYLKLGGHAAVVFDAGTQSMKGNFLDKAVFSQLIGIDYILYNQLQDSNNAYNTGYIQFKDQQSADFFQVPPGKLDDQFFLNGYSYGRLVYPIARVESKTMPDPDRVYAYTVTEEKKTYPLILLQDKELGKLLYINLPLGHLKSYSDDLPIRSILRTLLFKIARLPHLVNTFNGKAGLVINWHIDWNKDIDGIAFMKDNGYFTPGIQYSIHNTAGDFTDKPGDRLGFDACGAGKETLTSILKYGHLGSHGGWAHNWFYHNILDGTFGEKEIEEYIVKNNQCLESLAGYPIIEYSAPNGVHPQPLTTQILERNGFIAYYYTGDSGSAPNRTFYEKEMVSGQVIAFPVLAYRHNASFFEMNRDGVSSLQFRQWLSDLLAFLMENRTVRLIYSHSYDVAPYYPGEFKNFILEVDRLARAGHIYAKPMSFFAGFTRRFLKTTYRFRLTARGLQITLANPEGLEGVTIAIPVEYYKKPSNDKNEVEIEADAHYYYLILKENINEKILEIPSRAH